MGAELSWVAKKAQQHQPWDTHNNNVQVGTWGDARNKWELRCMSKMAKGKYIGSITCGILNQKNLWIKSSSRNRSGDNQIYSYVFLFCLEPYKLRPCWHFICATAVSKTQVTVSRRNNAALTGQTGGGLIGWLRGCMAIIHTRKSYAFSQIIPSLKAPIVAQRLVRCCLNPPLGQQCRHSWPLTATDWQFQVWIGCVGSGLY